MTDDEVTDYAGNLAEERVKAICRDHRSYTAQLACVRDEVFRGFDTTGEAKRNCDRDAPMEDLLRCAIIGSAGYEIALAGRLPEADDYDWQDPNAAFSETLTSLSNAQVEACKDGSRSAREDCFVTGIGGTFSLTEQQIATCVDMDDLGESLHCIARVHLMQRVESAVARMSVDFGVQI